LNNLQQRIIACENNEHLDLEKIISLEAAHNEDKGKYAAHWAAAVQELIKLVFNLEEGQKSF